MTLAAFTAGLVVGCVVAAFVWVAVGAAIGAAVTWDRPRDVQVPGFVPDALVVTW